MTNVLVEIPADVVARLRESGSQSENELRIATAFSLCRQGELSTSQAARLAGLSYADFLEAAARAQLQLFPVDLDELKEEVTRGYTLGRQYVPGDPSSASGTS